jgi:hypothetical protein
MSVCASRHRCVCVLLCVCLCVWVCVHVSVCLRMQQSSALGAQIIQGDLEQQVKLPRVNRNCFQKFSGCYKI